MSHPGRFRRGIVSVCRQIEKAVRGQFTFGTIPGSRHIAKSKLSPISDIPIRSAMGENVGFFPAHEIKFGPGRQKLKTGFRMGLAPIPS